MAHKTKRALLMTASAVAFIALIAAAVNLAIVQTVANAAAAVVTALATGAIAYLTGSLRDVADKQFGRMKDVERAYLSGGGGIEGGLFKLQIENYGKTPGTVLAYAFEAVMRDLRPSRPAYLDPGYARVTAHRDVIPPGGNDSRRTVDRINLAHHAISQADWDKTIVYGRFWYKDIWGEIHSFGFALSMKADGNTAADMFDIPSAYVDEDNAPLPDKANRR
jgi:hypothetical protein